MEHFLYYSLPLFIFLLIIQEILTFCCEGTSEKWELILIYAP